MEKEADVFETVRSLFSNWLEENGQRKTPERFAILKEIYNRNDHFEADTLYKALNEGGFAVSRATIYNTLELLTQCDLVKKHQFDNKQALFEKSYGYKQHDHILCLSCSKVVEFCDPRMQETKNLMAELFHFEIAHHSLILYGYCQQCKQEKTS